MNKPMVLLVHHLEDYSKLSLIGSRTNCIEGPRIPSLAISGISIRLCDRLGLVLGWNVGVIVSLS